MSILVNEDTTVIVQGITGREGGFHAEEMRALGTKIVAGVTPGKGDRYTGGVPVFNTVREAVAVTGADVSVLFVPAAASADAACEAASAGVKLIVLITEHVPVLDAIRCKSFVEGHGARLIGPNTPGIISPGKCKIGIMPGYIHTPGRIGVISRSGTLAYEVVYQLTAAGLGQSTCIGIGGDPVPGMNFVDLLALFKEDPATDAVCLIGEIGGEEEEKAAAYLQASEYPKPVFGFISGLSAPAGKRMGHAGAIIIRARGNGEDKLAALRQAGVIVEQDLGQFGRTVAATLSASGR